MGYTKRQFLDAAFTEIGMANYVFDLQAEDLQTARRRLDSMMAEWNGRGVRLGYPIPASPDDDDLDDATGVPDSAIEAIITNFGIRIAPSYGKSVSPDTKTTAKNAYNMLLARATFPCQMQLPAGMPGGAGRKPCYTYDEFLSTPHDTLDAGNDSAIEFE